MDDGKVFHNQWRLGELAARNEMKAYNVDKHQLLRHASRMSAWYNGYIHEIQYAIIDEKKLDEDPST